MGEIINIREIIGKTGRVEVNLAPLLIVIGFALASDRDGSVDNMLDMLQCPEDEL